MKQVRAYRIIAMASLVVAYVTLRFWNRTASCLWFDEIFSVQAAEHSWNSLFSFVALDLIHPPLFYLLLKLWIGIGGESLLWLRSFPVLLAVIAIFPFLSLCRELRLNFWSRVVALFFLSVNGSLIKYSQEVRMYSLLFCLSLFSMWLFSRYFIKGKSYVPLLIVNILLVYTHYFGWFVAISEIAAILIFQIVKWRRIMSMFAIMLASFTPWIVAIWNAVRTGSEISQNIGWMSRPGPPAIVQFILNLCEPFYSAPSNIAALSVYRVTIPILLLTVVALVMTAVSRNLKGDREHQSFYLLGLFALIPLVIVLLASWILPYSIWGTRHLIIVFPPILIIVAMSITRISTDWLRIGTLTFVTLLIGYGFVLQIKRPVNPPIWCAWETLAHAAAVSEVAQSTPPGIYAFEDLVVYHLWFATKNDVNRPLVTKIVGIDGIAEDKAYFLPRGFDEIETRRFESVNDPTIRIVFRAELYGESEPPLSNFIARGYSIEDAKSYETTMGNGYLVTLKKEK